MRSSFRAFLKYPQEACRVQSLPADFHGASVCLRCPGPARGQHLRAGARELIRCPVPGRACAPQASRAGEALTRVQASPPMVRAGEGGPGPEGELESPFPPPPDPGNIYGLLEGWTEGGGGLGCRGGRGAQCPRVPAGGRRVRNGDPEPPTSGRVSSRLEATAAWRQRAPSCFLPLGAGRGG